MTDFPGWKYYQTVTPSAAVHSGALTGYQYPIKVIVGSGTAAAYTHQTGIGGSLIYVPSGHCRSDFYDFRFYVGTTLCDHHRISKTDGVQAEFNVELPNDVTSPEAIIIRYGNFYASSDTSSAADTYVSAPIPGLVGAWALEEADAEVNPTVIADDDQVSFWTLAFGAAGSYSFTEINDSVEKRVGTDSYRIDVAVGSYATCYFYHSYAVNQDWSSKSRIVFDIYGTNSGRTFELEIRAADNSNKFRKVLTDNFTGWQRIVIPFGSFIQVGSPNWATVKLINIFDIYPNQNGIRFDRWVVDVGVVAVDSSGYGNNGAATGTTITTSPFYTGKYSRQWAGVNGEYIDLTSNVTIGANNTLFFKAKIGAQDYQGIISNKSGSQYWNYFRFGQSANQYDDNIFGETNTDGDFIPLAFNSVLNITIPHAFAITQDDAKKWELYLDGTAQTATATTTANSLVFGRLGQGRSGIDPLKGILGHLIKFNAKLSPTEISVLSNSTYYPDVGLVVGSVCPRKYAATTNPTHASATSEVISTSGDEQYYYYNEYFTLTPKQEAKLTPQQKQRRAQHEALNQTPQLKQNRVDWSRQAVESHILDLSSSRILEEAKQLGLIKKRN